MTSKQREEQVGGIESLGQNIIEEGVLKIHIHSMSGDPKGSAKIMRVAEHTFRTDRLNMPLGDPHLSNEIGQVEKGIDTIVGETTVQRPSTTPAQSTSKTGHEFYEPSEPSESSHSIEIATGASQKSPAIALTETFFAFPACTMPAFGVAVSPHGERESYTSQISSSSFTSLSIKLTEVQNPIKGDRSLNRISIFGTTIEEGASPVSVSSLSIASDNSDKLVTQASNTISDHSSLSLDNGFSTQAETTTSGRPGISIDAIQSSSGPVIEIILSSNTINVQNKTTVTVDITAQTSNTPGIAAPTPNMTAEFDSPVTSAGTESSDRAHSGSLKRYQSCMWQLLMTIAVSAMILAGV